MRHLGPVKRGGGKVARLLSVPTRHCAARRPVLGSWRACCAQVLLTFPTGDLWSSACSTESGPDGPVVLPALSAHLQYSGSLGKRVFASTLPCPTFPPLPRFASHCPLLFPQHGALAVTPEAGCIILAPETRPDTFPPLHDGPLCLSLRRLTRCDTCAGGTLDGR